MAAQDECPPLPREKAGQQVSRYHVTAVDYRRKGTKSPASRELGDWNMKSFRLYVTKWERRDVAAWLLRSTIFSAIMLALLFVAGDLQGQPIQSAPPSTSSGLEQPSWIDLVLPKTRRP